jgi:hypothetical protein
MRPFAKKEIQRKVFLGIHTPMANVTIMVMKINNARFWVRGRSPRAD